ncbi:uncharacterized protein LOC135683325 [Rhopilema esculentum]|uniref:uncharacterized protein LOC135683325 n=1 Tax=Rhopilema esculentum TaxID=499914 RepID=UPI0031DA1006
MPAYTFISLAFIILQLCQAWKEELAPESKFHSALQYPHISFRGGFKANVATANNVPANFDNENFFGYDQFSNNYGGKGQWNPQGTNDLILIDCHVTGACPAIGECTESSQKDTVCGTPVTDGGFRTFAKMVDLDPAYQIVPEIWGMKMLLPGFFEGELEATPLTDYWLRGVGHGDNRMGGAYRSYLKDVIWHSNAESSTTVSQMKKMFHELGSHRLSVLFYLDSYKISFLHSEKGFALGRIIGTIGVLGPLSPSRSLWSRSLAAIHRIPDDGDFQLDNTSSVFYTNDASFVVDKKQKKLFINFENSLMTDQNGDPKSFPHNTKIGYFKQTYGLNTTKKSNCSHSTIILDDTSKLNFTNLFLNFGGILSLALSDKQTEDLDSVPLSVFQVKGTRCRLIMQEYSDGILVKAYNKWVFRLEAKETITSDVFVTKFGKPLPNTAVAVSPYNSLFDSVPGSGKFENAKFSKKVFYTNITGIATLRIPTISSNFRRKSLDGNLEGYYFYVPSSKMHAAKVHKRFSMIVARVYSQFSYPEDITWSDHIRPIFQTYANLFPVMNSRSLDLGNYFDVVEHKSIISTSMSLPMSHPSFMPATRDLSKKKRRMILKWLAQERPKLGNVSVLFTKHYLLQLLQTALEVTHASLPPFLNALWSIKGKYNRKVASVINKVINHEVNKIGIIASLMSTLGGRAKFVHKDFLPFYPGRFPGGIQSEVLLSVEKLSAKLFRSSLMKAKRPEINYLSLWFRNAVFQLSFFKKYKRCVGMYARQNPSCRHKRLLRTRHYSNILAGKMKRKCNFATKTFLAEYLEKLKMEKPRSSFLDPQDRTLFQYHSSINKLFDHILFVLSYITGCGSNDTLFRAPKKWPLKIPRRSIFGSIPVISDYSSAVDAIRRLMRITNSFDTGVESQYKLLLSIVQESSSLPVFKPSKKFPRSAFYAANALAEKSKHKSQIDVPIAMGIAEHGVWPIASNPKIHHFPNGTLRNTAIAFNDIYTSFLVYCELLFKTSNDTLRWKYLESVDKLATAMRVLGKRLVQTPIHKRGNRYVGPNGAPTFEIDFQFGFLLTVSHSDTLRQLEKAKWKVNVYAKEREKFMKKGINSYILTLDSTSKKKYSVPVSEEDRDVFRPLAENPLVDVTAAYDSL